MEKKPYITAEEVLQQQGEGKRGYTFLSEANGCLSGCRSGVTLYADTQFSSHPGVHEDQEGFYVLEGEGFAKLGDLEFPIAPGDSFIALPGVPHTIRTREGACAVRVFWFHSAVKDCTNGGK